MCRVETLAAEAGVWRAKLKINNMGIFALVTGLCTVVCVVAVPKRSRKCADREGKKKTTLNAMTLDVSCAKCQMQSNLFLSQWYTHCSVVSRTHPDDEDVKAHGTRLRGLSKARAVKHGWGRTTLSAFNTTEPRTGMRQPRRWGSADVGMRRGFEEAWV